MFDGSVADRLRQYHHPHPAKRRSISLRSGSRATKLTRKNSRNESAYFLTECKALRGCRFALDDFGSGFSSFKYLKTLPVDYLKIDGSFVKDIVDNPIDYAMVKSINEIAHVMGKQTIAEYVENDAILQRVREAGVNYAQGNGIGLPIPIEELM